MYVLLSLIFYPLTILCCLILTSYRLLSGVLVDRKKVRKTLLIQISFAATALLGFGFSFWIQRTSLMVYAALFGLLGGIFIPLCIPLLVELVNERQVSSAAGLFPLFTGLGISLGPPILGKIYTLHKKVIRILIILNFLYSSYMLCVHV